jgi:GMP reductase
MKIKMKLSLRQLIQHHDKLKRLTQSCVPLQIPNKISSSSSFSKEIDRTMTTRILDRPFDFHQVNLIPQLGIVKSRQECLTEIQIGSFIFKVPVVPSNMETVMNEELAVKLAVNGYFYIHHRFQPDEILGFCQRMRERGLLVSISIGVGKQWESFIQSLIEESIIPDFITIDIAHGHCIMMKEMIEFIKKQFPIYSSSSSSSSGEPPIVRTPMSPTFPRGKVPIIIAGNVSTPDAVSDLESWGADIIKIGIGPGMACTTYSCTGFGSRGLQAFSIYDCARNGIKKLSTRIIADGGIREPGDIAKSLALGADMVMIGSSFASCIDSPATFHPLTSGKEYYGSASAHQSGKTSRIEGTRIELPMSSRTYLQEMRYLQECLQSAISYGGGKTLSALYRAKYHIRYS